MTYNIIATGSSGNAVLINDSILIDCGVSWRLLEPFAKQIRLVLLTHIHGDHFKPSTVRALHRERPAVRWACCEWMATPLLDAGVDKLVIDVMQPENQKGLDVAGAAYAKLAMVYPFTVPHNVPNCGWKIGFCGGKKLFYCTDCATLDGIKAENFDLYMIEANHTSEEIKARIAAKQAAGEYAYEFEAMRNHLSHEQAMDWLALNMGQNSRYILLHQHQEREKSNVVRSTSNDGAASEDAEAGAAAQG